MASPVRFRALTLDVGGVFVVPHHDLLSTALTDAGVDHDRASFWDGHYLAMHGVDADQSPAETFDAYVPAFVHGIGLRDAAFERAVEALDALFGPSGLWHQPIPDAAEDLRILAAADIPMAVVSNADGTVAQILADLEVCQVGPGPAVEVVHIVDSGAIGIAKPDPLTFQPALDALGFDPADVVHVGDSVHYDVEGARAAGMQAVHHDPRGLCRSDDHPHIRRLVDLVDGLIA